MNNDDDDHGGDGSDGDEDIVGNNNYYYELENMFLCLPIHNRMTELEQSVTPFSKKKNS